MPERDYVLEVRGLRYAYPDGTVAPAGTGALSGTGGREALKGVSLVLGAGEKLALVGPNGSGKSTLLLHLAGAILIQSGEVLLHGEPVGGDMTRLRGAVGLIFQEPDDQLFMPRVVEDVAFGLVTRGVPVAEAQARALEMLESLGIAHLAERPPHRLSGGEKRIVSLAGILVMAPEVLALDEPTAALDSQARRRVIRCLQSMEGPMILATHDLDMALDVCARAVVLHEGRVPAEGALPGLFRDEALLERCGLEPPPRR